MRITAVCLLVLLIIFAPFWLYLPALFLSIVYFDYFVEGIVLALVIDVVYGPAGHSILFGFPFAIISAVLVLISIIVRERLRIYA